MNGTEELRENIEKEEKIAGELFELFSSLEKTTGKEEKEMIESQVKKLKSLLKKTNNDVKKNLEKISLIQPLTKQEIKEEKEEKIKEKVEYNLPKKWKELTSLEKEVLKRLKKREKKEIKQQEAKKTKKYVYLSNKFFSNLARSLSKKEMFKKVGEDLQKTNLEFTLQSYLSVMFFTIFLSFFIAFFVFIPIMLIDLGNFPTISLAKNLPERFIRFFGLIFVAPLITFIFMYIYPSTEKKSLENSINQELPFATIHMSAISGSMIEPSKIFQIIIDTGEYSHLKREFTKILNLVNVYGYDLVTALKNVAINSPSKKFADLLNSLATTVTSGGDLPDFFEKRAQSLLFEYRLEREKYTKTAETFMDIYISVVIAAPMIFLLLLIIMRVSGLGISLSGTTISLMMIIGVVLINILFIILLNARQPKD